MSKARLVTISTAKASKSAQYRDSWIGTQAFWTSYEGDEVLGTITGWAQYHPVVTFNDGTHARLDSTFFVLEAK